MLDFQADDIGNALGIQEISSLPAGRANRFSMKTLLIDADDTLWENNIYFEQVRKEFLNWMEALGYPVPAVSELFDSIEKANIVRHGYGGENFISSLKETYLKSRSVSRVERLAAAAGILNPQLDPANTHKARALPPAEGLDRIEEMAQTVRAHPIELLDGVQESLKAISRKCRTILFTKGSFKEQDRKIQASGLSRYFNAIEIVREKDVAAFEEVIQRHHLAKPITWMVGNSPKSDVNPAVAAGLRAFYIPHAQTWEREREDLCAWEQVTILDRFSDLLRYL